ncbi:PAS domain-containing sensor histidine kinase [Crateriforma conspicua]|uniref:histidine kinase n=1 Tax=Crateriforma conspicua TaxID=2527996 RepID=A0A5C5XXW5_9PLAN|nr:PAS domain S-box protein [Crateriforma conspicua]QDV62981.1 Sensor protein FixL [Crateriforma conspicua]TWT68246.1 Sensor protein FixL [Crateriforma conspicua]
MNASGWGQLWGGSISGSHVIAWALGAVVAVGLDRAVRHLHRSRQHKTDRKAIDSPVNPSTQQLLDTIVNSIPSSVFWKDRDSVYLGCNQAFANAAGLADPAQIVGLTDFDLPWSKEEAEFYRQCDRDVMERRQVILNLEEPQTRPGGQVEILLTSKTPLTSEDDDVIGIVGIFSDITEMRQAQAQRDRLLVEAAELAQVIRDSPDEVFIFSRDDLRFVDVNQGACDATGYSVDELRQMTPMDLRPDFGEQEYRSLIEPLATGQVSHLEIQATHQDRDGNTSPVKVNLHATDYRGQAVYVAFVSDLTEVKRLEQRLVQAQKLESIGQLSTGIAHEINTPMQFLHNNVSYLNLCCSRLFSVVDGLRDIALQADSLDLAAREQLVGDLEYKFNLDHTRRQIPQAISDSEDGIDRTVQILEAMKQFSHPGVRELSNFDLNELVQSTLTISRHRWKDSAAVEVDLAEPLPVVQGYPADLGQVILNLLVNSVDAIEDRFGDSGKGLIRICSCEDNGGVVLTVQDDGGGIDEAILHRVFDPFFTTKEVGQGTGQGLSICHDVVTKMHGGRLEVDTVPGDGTTFKMWLPAEAPAVEPELEPSVTDQQLAMLGF